MWSSRNAYSIIALALVMSFGGAGYATMVTAEIRDSVGDAHSVQVPDATYDVPLALDVYLTTDINTPSGEMRIQTLDAGGVFELTGRTFDTIAGWGYYPLDFTGPDLLNRAPDSRSSQLIGCLSKNAFVPAGTSRFMTFNLTVKAGTTSGDYRLNLVSVLVSDETFSDQPGLAGAAYTIQVLPEPTTALLLIGGFLVLQRKPRGA